MFWEGQFLQEAAMQYLRLFEYWFYTEKLVTPWKKKKYMECQKARWLVQSKWLLPHHKEKLCQLLTEHPYKAFQPLTTAWPELT